MDNQDAGNGMPTVLFREIHKNAFLKRHWSEKKSGFARRAEKVWVVLCVHDDNEAFLELYPDHKIALAHKPDWFISLHTALHVSPTICGYPDEYEFAITLPTQVIRLAAPSWEAMMEWVQTVGNKLRELRVLAPKENVYTKMPEPRPHVLLPTRDPTSPLPLPPLEPVGPLLGIESPRTTHADVSEIDISSESSSRTNHTRNITRNENSQLLPLRSRNENNISLLHGAETLSSAVAQVQIAPEPSERITSEDRSVVNVDVSTAEVSSIGQRKDAIDVQAGAEKRKVKNTISSNGSSSSFAAVSREQVISKRGVIPEINRTVITNNEELGLVVSLPEPIDSGGKVNTRPPVVAPSGSNVTVIEVPPPSQHYEHLFPTEGDRPVLESRSKLERVCSSGLIPRVPSRRDSDHRAVIVSPPRTRDRHQVSTSQNGTSDAAASSHIPSTDLMSHTSIVTVVGREKAPSPPRELPVQTSIVRVGSSAGASIVTVEAPASTPLQALTATVPPVADVVPPIPAAFQPAPSGLDVRDIPLIGGHQRRRRRSSSSDATPVPRVLVGADLIRMGPTEAPEVPADVPHRTLREAQVCQLNREISHPGGVRLPLRRKDCVGSIALVDIGNAVWVAGWKQREHPMLYNALHIGDQILSIGDAPVRSSAEGQKLLRSSAGPTVDLVVRRLPLGLVLALQRPRGNGDIGLLPDASNPAEVSVVPNGVAARSGLPQRTTTLDGLSLTTWTLTEINSRPLSLFCKSSDVATRLNSVGKEVSVLVQPSDFIKLMRKQLKAIRGYKDYLLM